MASSPPKPRPSKIIETLRYFDKYDYPLNSDEIFFYSSLNPSPDSGEGTKRVEYVKKDQLFFLAGRQKIVALRKEREKISEGKWQLAREVGEKLKKFGFITAVFVTGSLAMNNAKKSDDIDLMVITKPNTLWITRFLVNIYLHSVRRYPNQLQVSNVICINLWLDENNLLIKLQNLYTAHEIMQAKVLWDRNDIHKKFLAANYWVKDFLPNAYTESQIPNPKSQKRRNWGLWLVNCGFFLMQYLYMRSRMTTEQVGPGFAFFHPKSLVI